MIDVSFAAGILVGFGSAMGCMSVVAMIFLLRK